MKVVCLGAFLATAHADSCQSGECAADEAALLQAQINKHSADVDQEWAAGYYSTNFDWDALAHQGMNCSEVCIGEQDQCYPIKDNGYMGTPCGVLSQGNPQGCFMNSPTQTCALCTTEQPYCCPTSKVKRCKKQPEGAKSTEAAGGGVDHGSYQNDFDWKVLANKKPDSSEVCRGENDQCYPVNAEGYLGSPCGVLSMGNPQGCFMNSPTQTCALCTTAQSYCVPTSKIPRCKKQKKSAPVPVYGGGGVTGGLSHGIYQNDFDWEALANKGRNCSEVCFGENNQCYPIKDNGYMGSPCGVLSQGNPQGCFMNSPTQTCALCTTEQPYCCPSSKVERCKKQ